MTHRARTLAVLPALLLAALVALLAPDLRRGAAAEEQAAGKHPALVILATAGNRGEVEPCG